MTRIAIAVENLSKQYRLDEIGRGTLAKDARRWWTRMRHRRGASRSDGPRDVEGETIWALRDVDLRVEQGEAVGIVGRNGAGKSTLLKILSRTTAPTSGSVKLRGRVASLLEVGTGFHPDLTGRENIFLNGAILGLRRAEIASRFDAIVAFAETEAFLDVPVKRYSSGMYTRLAFAVSAHLQPDILVVDEVLAVGDAAFQKKCLGKMGEAARGGRTILFVSHNLVAVQSLCSRAVWLDGGRVAGDGAAPEIVGKYLGTTLAGTGCLDERWDDPTQAPGDDRVRLTRVRTRAAEGAPWPPTMETPVEIEVDYRVFVPAARVHITLHVLTEQNIVAFTSGSSSDATWRGRSIGPGQYRATCHVPGSFLNAGRYRLRVLVVWEGSSVFVRYDSQVVIDVVDATVRGIGWHGREPGVLQPRLEWSNEALNDAESAGSGPPC